MQGLKVSKQQWSTILVAHCSWATSELEIESCVGWNIIFISLNVWRRMSQKCAKFSICSKALIQGVGLFEPF